MGPLNFTSDMLCKPKYCNFYFLFKWVKVNFEPTNACVSTCYIAIVKVWA